MDRLFGDASWGSGQSGERSGPPTSRLPVDIAEMEDAYRVQAPVPGFRPEDVEVTFSDLVLSFWGRRSEERRQQEGRYVRREVYGNWERQILLPGEIQADRISASFENGVLTVEVPRAPKPEPRRIEIKRSQLRAGGSRISEEAVRP
jgi:HSP20 family molecular chaperone IbpA